MITTKHCTVSDPSPIFLSLCLFFLHRPRPAPIQQYDEAHGLSERTGGALASGLDKLTEILTPPPPNTRPRGGSGNNNLSSIPDDGREHRRNDAQSARRHGAGARGGEEAGGWPWWRDGLVKHEAARRRPGGAGGQGKRWVWRAEMSDGGRGAEAGREQHEHQRSQRRREEELSRSWTVLPMDEEF